MRKKMGENITSEWLRDAEADKVWDALQLIRSDPESGVVALLELANKKSSLALMFAGNIYAKGEYGIAQDSNKGKFLLDRSFKLGSIEGGFVLANLLINEGDYEKSLQLYEELASRNYSPANYCLGYYYCYGDMSYRDLKKGLNSFRNGVKFGHLPSMNEFANQSIIQNRRYYDIIWSLYLKFINKCCSTYLYFTYPNSDRLRV